MERRHYIEERVRFNTEIIKFLGLIFLAAISGVITLIYQWDGFTGKNFILTFFGLVAIFVLGGLIYNIYSETMSLRKTEMITISDSDIIPMIITTLAAIPFFTLLFLLLRDVRRNRKNDELDKTKILK